MFHRCLLITILLCAVGCGRPADDTTVASEPGLIQGELNQDSYNDAAARVLTDAVTALSDPTLTETKLDRNIARVETLMSLSGQLNVDKSQLHDAELISTLGAMYSRKAAFHSDNSEQAGALAASGFRYLDRAIIKYPNNITARINRGLTCEKVPEFMNKTEVALDDLKFVVKSPEFASLPAELQAQVNAALLAVEGRMARRAA